MNSWKRVDKDLVRIFFSHDQHIAVVIGKKPRQCAQIELAEVNDNPKVPIVSVQCTCLAISDHARNHGFETYCLVKPVLAGRRRPFVTLLHREGSELVQVETVASERPEKRSDVIASAMGF